MLRVIEGLLLWIGALRVRRQDGAAGARGVIQSVSAILGHHLLSVRVSGHWSHGSRVEADLTWVDYLDEK